MDERSLTERLITYDTSTLEGMQTAAGFVKGWLEARDVEVKGDARTTAARCWRRPSAPRAARRVVLHGHLDVVPGARRSSSCPRIEGDRLYRPRRLRHEGRPRGDDVRDCATSPRRTRVRVHFVVRLRRGVRARRTAGAPTTSSSRATRATSPSPASPPTCTSACRPRACWPCGSRSRGTAAHGSTPWVGDNAVLKAVDVFRVIESLPFARESSDLFDRPSINLGRIIGGDAAEQGARPLRDRRRHPLPARPGPRGDPRRDRRELPDTEVIEDLPPRAASSSRENPYVHVLAEAVAAWRPRGERISVGRDGTSDAISFLEAGVPAVEFGPVGGGHHGPEEWVSIASLDRYRTRWSSSSTAARALAAAATRPSRLEDRVTCRVRRQHRGPALEAAACSAPCWSSSPPPGARAVAAFREVDKVVDALKDGSRAQARRRPRRDRSGQAADDHAASAPTAGPKRRPTAARHRRALGHDHPRPPRPREEGHRADVAAARPQGRDPRPRHRQDQRRLLELGGPKLTLKTVKQLTGLSINHVINVDFRGFSEAVNAIGCVYIDIDRRYFNNTARSTPTSTSRRATRSCAASEALDYVRFRHEDTDLVRAARQQDFLRQAKQQIGVGKLIEDRDKLIEDLRQVHDSDIALSARPSPAPAQAGRRLGRPADPRGPLRGRDRRRAT